MERKIGSIRPHQIAGLYSGGEGYSSKQTEVLAKLRRYPVYMLNVSPGKSDICDICPLNPDSLEFDPDLGICDPDSPGLIESDNPS